MRYLIEQFLKHTNPEYLLSVLLYCLNQEIICFRDKMNNTDTRCYNYIKSHKTVAMEIVQGLLRLKQDVVIMEWMCDWTAFLYFCQYVRGPFYDFLHPQEDKDDMNKKVVRSYKNSADQSITCCHSIVSLSLLTKNDYLNLIKEGWSSSYSITEVHVDSTQIEKLQKFRKCVELYFLQVQKIY
jgi:hypothetical protein